MPEELLNSHEINPVHDEVRGKGVPEIMESDTLYPIHEYRPQISA